MVFIVISVEWNNKAKSLAIYCILKFEDKRIRTKPTSKFVSINLKIFYCYITLWAMATPVRGSKKV